MDGCSTSRSGINRQSHCCGCRAGCWAGCWAGCLAGCWLFRTNEPCGSRTTVKGLRPVAVFKKNRTRLREGARGAAGCAFAGRLLGVTPAGAEAPAAGPCSGSGPLTTVWALPTGPSTLTTLPALTRVAGVLGDELPVDVEAAGSVLTRFTSTGHSWQRLGGAGAGAGKGASRRLLARCGGRLVPGELFPELQGTPMAAGASWTPCPSAEGWPGTAWGCSVSSPGGRLTLAEALAPGLVSTRLLVLLFWTNPSEPPTTLPASSGFAPDR